MENIPLMSDDIPRFKSCSFYPYSMNEKNEAVILFRQKNNS